MKLTVVLKVFIYLVLLCGVVVQSDAQTDDASDAKTFNIEYSGLYQLQDSYSIIYNNTVETAKLKDFRVTFYGPGKQELSQTDIQTHPVTGKIVTYILDAPVSGFNEVELSILSLHSGEIDAFPANIGAILALNELTKVTPPPPPPPPPTPPDLAPDDEQRIADTRESISKISSTLGEKSDALARAKAEQSTQADALLALKTNTSALTAQALVLERTDLKTQIDELNSRIESLKAKADATASSLSQHVAKLAELQSEAAALQTNSQTLQQQSKTVGVEASAVLSSLDDIEDRLETLDSDIAVITLSYPVAPAEIAGLETDYLALKAKLETPPLVKTLDWRIIAAALLAALALIGLAAKFIFAPTAKAHPPKSILNRASNPGVIFPASPMLAGNVAAPLAPAGQLAAAQLQMLSGPYAVLRDAYLATGRIGYAQIGVPSAEDYAFGTGFLVSDRHVVTNRHVHGLYGHYLLDKSDPGGIEFIAEKGKDASDFAPFNGEPPLLLPALDIAIYTLARPVTNRTPLALKSMPTEDLHPRDIVIIGYPDTHTPEKPDVLAVVEDDPIFAVKRISQGQIFRHSTDMDRPFGVETFVSESKNSNFIMPAICHNASTMGGNSGSPLLDIKSGQLLGVHFKGFKVFNQEEAANLAMTIAQLTQSEALKTLPHVTPITAQSLKNS